MRSGSSLGVSKAKEEFKFLQGCKIHYLVYLRSKRHRVLKKVFKLCIFLESVVILNICKILAF
mgnify:CR=1 FL=1